MAEQAKGGRPKVATSLTCFGREGFDVRHEVVKFRGVEAAVDVVAGDRGALAAGLERAGGQQGDEDRGRANEPALRSASTGRGYAPGRAGPPQKVGIEDDGKSDKE